VVFVYEWIPGNQAPISNPIECYTVRFISVFGDEFSTLESEGRACACLAVFRCFLNIVQKPPTSIASSISIDSPVAVACCPSSFRKINKYINKYK
jgi:hypothetical protein